MANQLIVKFANRYSVEESKVEIILKNTCFKVQAAPISFEQLCALLIVADQYGLNPFTKEIYAYPDKNNSIVPVVGVDGWSRIINEHPQFDGVDFSQTDEECVCRIYRKDRAHPTIVTEYLQECRRAVGPWQTHPKRMLRHKAFIQCARLAFGFVGIFDQDEAERITELKDITPEPARRITPHEIIEAKSISETTQEREQLIQRLEAIVLEKGFEAYCVEFYGMTHEERKMLGSTEHNRLRHLGEKGAEYASA